MTGSSETAFIASLRGLPLHPGAHGLRDDAAVLDAAGLLVVTQDTLVQGVHVREDEDLADVAWKLVAVNLSDLASKGARPVGVIVSHMLGDDDARFLTGLRKVLQGFAVPLIGGDTVAAEGRRVWTCTALGCATHVPVPRRTGAQPGDAVYVTGVLGRAMLGMEERGSGSANDLAYRRPTPLIKEGQALAPHVSAMMDVSDGLLLDAWRMAEASDCTFALDEAATPVADPRRADECLRWGDDYQLLFTAAPDTALPTSATRIGSVEPKSATHLQLDGQPLHPDTGSGLGYRHG